MRLQEDNRHRSEMFCGLFLFSCQNLGLEKEGIQIQLNKFSKKEGYQIAGLTARGNKARGKARVKAVKSVIERDDDF